MKNNKYLTILIIIGVIFFLISFFRSFYDGFQRGLNQSQISNSNTTIASGLNRNLPMMVDEETQLDNVVPMPNNTLQYNYTLVKTTVDSINVSEFTNSMKETLLSQIKSNPQIAPIRNANTTLSYYYKDKNDKFITKIDITPEIYKMN